MEETFNFPSTNQTQPNPTKKKVEKKNATTPKSHDTAGNIFQRGTAALLPAAPAAALAAAVPFAVAAAVAVPVAAADEFAAQAAPGLVVAGIAACGPVQSKKFCRHRNKNQQFHIQNLRIGRLVRSGDPFVVAVDVVRAFLVSLQPTLPAVAPTKNASGCATD